MYVVVVGMGEVGRHVVRTLEWEQNDVVAIDEDPDAIRYVEEHHDVMTVLGYGASQDVLRRADVGRAELFVACTDNDEINLVAALAAKQLGARRTIARVQGRHWAGRAEGEGIEYGLLGVDVVFNPRVLLAHELANIAQSHGALEVVAIASNRLEVVQLELDEHNRMLHKPIARLPLPRGVLVGAVVRDRELFVPGGADVLLPEDRVYLLGLPDEVEQASDQIVRGRDARRVCIVGGGVVGELLARQLAGAGHFDVLLVERSPERARELAADLDGVAVVQGDGTDLDLLRSEQVGNYDLFCAVSHEDEVNLMAGLLAKRAGVARVATLVHRPDYVDIYRQLGVDVVLSPRTIAADHILRYCRQAELRSLTLIEEGKAEILEIVAPDESRVIGLPVRRLPVPRGALLAAIIKADRVVIPRGDDVIEPGDTVVVLTTQAARGAVGKMFRKRVL